MNTESNTVNRLTSNEGRWAGCDGHVYWLEGGRWTRNYPDGHRNTFPEGYEPNGNGPYARVCDE